MDVEIKAMAEAVEYMNQADERSRERFVCHLVHKYFPDGRFIPKERKVDPEDFSYRKPR